MTASRFALLGRSRAGLSVAAALRAAGMDWIGTWNRSSFEPTPSEPCSLALEARDVDLHVIAVRDDAIEEVTEHLVRSGTGVRMAVHLSGARGPTALDALVRGGASIGFVHPIRSFPAADLSGDGLRGVACGVSLPPAAATLRAALNAAGARLLEVEVGKEAGYHAACTIAANLTVALLDLAVSTCVAAGVPEDEARRTLSELAAGCASAVGERGAEAALTGPAARGDADVVASHLGVLTGDARDVYVHLTARAIEIARRSGLEPEAARRLLDVLGRPGPSC